MEDSKAIGNNKIFNWEINTRSYFSASQAPLTKILFGFTKKNPEPPDLWLWDLALKVLSISSPSAKKIESKVSTSKVSTHLLFCYLKKCYWHVKLVEFTFDWSGLKADMFEIFTFSLVKHHSILTISGSKQNCLHKSNISSLMQQYVHMTNNTYL